jgi:hypothetical protein
MVHASSITGVYFQQKHLKRRFVDFLVDMMLAKWVYIARVYQLPYCFALMVIIRCCYWISYYFTTKSTTLVVVVTVNHTVRKIYLHTGRKDIIGSL